MAIKEQPESNFDFSGVKNIDQLKVGIVVSEWNTKITSSLLKAALNTFQKHGIKEENIIVQWVPGSFELALGAQMLFDFKNVEAVAALGCVIKGETPHFHFISEAVSLNIGELNLKYKKPVGFGVITAETEEHAIDRAGGKKGNKGEEAAEAVLKMLKLKHELEGPVKKVLGF